MDYDSGGFVIGEIVKSLSKIIPEKEKEKKIENVHYKYSDWWLILVSYIGFSLNIGEVKQLKQLPISSRLFSRILIVSYNNHEIANEIFARKNK